MLGDGGSRIERTGRGLLPFARYVVHSPLPVDQAVRRLAALGGATLVVDVFNGARCEIFCYEIGSDFVKLGVYSSFLRMGYLPVARFTVVAASSGSRVNWHVRPKWSELTVMGSILLSIPLFDRTLKATGAAAVFGLMVHLLSLAVAFWPASSALYGRVEAELAS